MNFIIKHIDVVQGSIEIDWLNGITLIHSIPLYILENPGLSQERIIQELEYMRPPIPEPIEVPETLLDLVEEPEPEPEPDPEPDPERLKEQVTDIRWVLMTGGFALPDGTIINTTVEDQNRISGIVANAHLAGLDDSSKIDFKAANGWVQITIGELKNIVGLIGVFIQQLYSTEKAHHENIDSLTTEEELIQYDINQGWPSNAA